MPPQHNFSNILRFSHLHCTMELWSVYCTAQLNPRLHQAMKLNIAPHMAIYIGVSLRHRESLQYTRRQSPGTSVMFITIHAFSCDLPSQKLSQKFCILMLPKGFLQDKSQLGLHAASFLLCGLNNRSSQENPLQQCWFVRNLNFFFQILHLWRPELITGELWQDSARCEKLWQVW